MKRTLEITASHDISEAVKSTGIPCKIISANIVEVTLDDQTNFISDMVKLSKALNISVKVAFRCISIDGVPLQEIYNTVRSIL